MTTAASLLSRIVPPTHAVLPSDRQTRYIGFEERASRQHDPVAAARAAVGVLNGVERELAQAGGLLHVTAAHYVTLVRRAR
jgi:hypothetical protein